MDITYKKVGDYYYPELELPKKYKDFRLDKYGRLRLNYLKENKHIQYEIMKCEDTLIDHLKEVQELTDKGYKEITLLGQNVNSYMRMEKAENKNEKITSFAELLYEVNKIEGIERIRFVSPHPKDFTDDVIEAIKKCDKVCKLIHLPLQSGNTKVLKEMNRKYTKEQYLNLVEKMKKEIC